MITAAPVFKISFVILSTSVLLNAFQIPAITEHFRKVLQSHKNRIIDSFIGKKGITDTEHGR